MRTYINTNPELDAVAKFNKVFGGHVKSKTFCVSSVTKNSISNADWLLHEVFEVVLKGKIDQRIETTNI
ncbi:hypothetical protein A9Q99_23705 [Gammaproteobacteria bacterium 45_16_T64]|nr:hypothetical protein A9Q99_23705 [Gammaproteobacteria bacterium 45_16_T64]